MRFVRLFCLAALVAATPSAAQEIPIADWPLAAGSRVKIRSSILGDRFMIGTVVSATRDTLTFRSDRDSIATALIATERIRDIEIALGTHSNKAMGGFIGFLLGAVAGATIDAIAQTPCRSFSCPQYYNGPEIALGALIGGLTGAIAGAWLGRRPTTTWVPVTRPYR